MKNSIHISTARIRRYLSSLFAISILTLASIYSVQTNAKQLELNLGLSQEVLPSDQIGTVNLRVGLTGLSFDSEAERTPVNVALVLDRSGSMRGEKLDRAIEAAVMAVDLLEDTDVISVVAYDSRVNVIVPATRLDERARIKRRIRNIQASGKTALFAGVSHGAAQVRRYLNKRRVNRVILLSDGIANVGPSSPRALGNLGGSLFEEGVSVTTIGMGLDFNEDLMTRLAQRSDGNHAFVQNSTDLAAVFQREFGDVLNVVAQDIEIRIKLPSYIKPIRTLGRDADIIGQTVIANMQQLYGGQEKYLLLEVQADGRRAGERLELANVEVNYSDMRSGRVEIENRSVDVAYSDSRKKVVESIVPAVQSDVVEQEIISITDEAIRLRDSGRVQEAKESLGAASSVARDAAAAFNSPKLRKLEAEVQSQEESIENDAAWAEKRKVLRQDQYRRKNQSTY